YEAGVAIFGEEENAIQAYDVQSRTRKWRRALTVYRSATGIDITPVVKDGISFAAGDNGVVVATAIESGALKWHAILNPDFHSERDYYSVGRITVTDDYVVVGTNSSLLVGDERNAIYVLKRSDGTGMAKLT